MDKQKQIEEMAKILYGYSIDTPIDCEYVASVLLDKGYRKIPEGAIILTKEEIAALNEYQQKHFIGSEPNEE